MSSKANKKIIVGVLLALLVDIALGYLFLSNRALSHLAAWNIIDSEERQDLYWSPDKAPSYFRFESDIEEFQYEARSVVSSGQNDFQTVFALGRHVRGLGFSGQAQMVRVKWDSPQGLLGQVKEGAAGHCFHRAIILSSYLSDLGISSRLWALENELFDGTAHSINEVYIKDLNKWVFLDVTFGFYVTGQENTVPLSFLEFRERLLGSKVDTLVVWGLNGEIYPLGIPATYGKLVTCVFLRARNDFTAQYKRRYGRLTFLGRYFDQMPNSIRIGLGYFLSDAKTFIHYQDGYSGSLRRWVVTAKALFYFFISLSVGLIGLLLGWGFRICRSKNDTRQI